mmetsp:Transcript_25038/g.77221  ORF Transcript_25038/g.77221 Transcript_25038/m.77221 type:complete len:346 (+) Transcript_25038:202-1239(+)
MWEVAESMEKVQRYNTVLYYLTILPIMATLPLFLLVQFLLWYCILKTRQLRRVTGICPRLISTTQELQLYYFHDSCCCQKVQLALEEVGLALACHQVHLDIGRYGRYDHLKSTHMNRNPMATVPVLVHLGCPILDATTQIRYIEDMLDGNLSLAPSISGEKARMNKIIEECDIDLRPKALTNVAKSWGNAVQLFSLHNMSYSYQYFGFRKNIYALLKHPNPMVPLNRILFNLLHIRIEPSVSDEAVDRIEQATREYDSILADGRMFLCGHAYTLADVACLPLLHRMDQLGILEHFLLPECGPKKKNLLEYWRRMQVRTSFKKVFGRWEPRTTVQKKHPWFHNETA